MARIPNDELEHIKREVSLLRLVESQGHEVVRQGKDYVIACPFHTEDTPSLIISPKSNLYHCFGCEAAGSVIDWVMQTQGVSFRHAVEILRTDDAGQKTDAQPSGPVKYNTVPKLPTPVSEHGEDQAVLRQVIDYYHETLLGSEEGLAYLAKRGLDDAELIETFKLGLANRTLGLRLPQTSRKAGADIRGQLKRIGVYRETGREHFNGSLVIPVLDDDGTVREVYGRKLGDRLRKGTPKHTYLPGPHEGVFNRSGLVGCEEVILCESLIDALTFWRWGFRQVTSSYGANGFTEELLECLVAGGVKRVLIAYDRDESGDRAAAKLARTLNKKGIDAYRVLFPKGMDANEYACQMSPPQKSLALVIRKAEPIGKVVHTVASSLAAELAADELDTQATPAPTPAPAIPVDVKADGLYITLGDRNYRVKGFDQSVIRDTLKINLMVKQGDAFHLDTLDLYSSKHRQVFINQACVECGVAPDVIKTDLGKVLLQLETLQQTHVEADAGTVTDSLHALTDAEHEEALALLTSPDLLNRILSDFSLAGVVGEETNKLAGYLACVSRQCERPLAVVIQSSSAAGKSALMESILALMPEEERVQYSAMTGQSLFYMGETNLKHKILAIAEEEGAHNASYALKLLQSEGEVTIASTGKDDDSGDLVTKEYKVEGPVMLFLTTTAIDIDEELLNRCLVLTVNESREQTQAIHRAQRQRRTLQGLQHTLEKDRILRLHQNAQRLLKPLAVINPYADQLTFLDDKTRTRRDHEKYLTLIDSIALLHQYQRTIKTVESPSPITSGERAAIEYIEVTLDDIQTANRLAHDILGRTLDELPPQTRKLLTHIQAMVQAGCQAQGMEQKDFRFSRKDIREASGFGNTQTKIHCQRLEDMEYLLVHRGGRGQSMAYELLYTADNQGEEADAKRVMGLIDVGSLRYDANKSGSNAKRSGLGRPKSVSSRGQIGGVSESAKRQKATTGKGSSQGGRPDAENAHPSQNNGASYRTQSTRCTRGADSAASAQA
ncbi:CHC2 zinc finger domain-containing protein [uncultured Paraglaciecola sp.]|uniref:CHC2 zinc finger domain-containing protein n=1 Tax=uncultured Paraglaciecola sp. TaxID=1765024 RepID=UPI00261F7E32|nr:CHC2 zinc finger domain-containing protein [uncultured Paraglaciecola sp.]